MATKRLARAAALLIATAVMSCGGDDGEPKSSLTQRQRDSVLAESKLPGAGAVRGALSASDSADARAERLDADAP